MRRLLAFASLLAFLAVSASALATHQDPQKQLTKADNARARAMLLKRTDLSAGFRPQLSGGAEPHVACATSVSESDLTVTGDAEGQQLALGVVFVSSAARIYKSVADASASWRRSTSAAGTKCATELLRREFAKQGVGLVSLRKVSFPRVSERSVAYRVELSAMTSQGTAPVYVDIVALLRSRAQATVVVGSALVPPQRAEELRLARIVAGRMATTMRR
ncbi:MAG: hypothetical protein M3377_06205 [Actinomycetota bacterium]|nr:hypothetical protein [Actinomycetota bacterium]